MEYGIRELARLAGISPRTLRYYDQIGLLKPARVAQSGYRIYGPEEVALLQQILFYRERGFPLKTVQKLLYDGGFDRLRALEEHLAALEARKCQTAVQIDTVRKTICALKGVYHMTDDEKFRGIREEFLRDQKQAYGKEAEEKYGSGQVAAAGIRLENLSREDFEAWQALDSRLRSALEQSVAAERSGESSEGEALARLHREWLQMALPKYTPQIHRGIAAMYTADPRFTGYYDRNVPGCARLLTEAVLHWIH